ncbi:MAG: adenylyl-sulfate kinase [Chromatiales bacterium]
MTDDVYWHQGKISRLEREQRNGHKSFVLWFTGLSASGKSTFAHAVEQELYRRGKQVMVLDGDNVRHGLCSDLGFKAEDRQENLRRIGEVAKLFVEAGIIVLAAFVSPYRKDREQVRSMLPHGDFYEVFCDCDLSVCEERDPKGLYKKARAGEIRNFTGISDPYEPPVKPDMVFDTGRTPVDDNLHKLIGQLESKRLIAQ